MGNFVWMTIALVIGGAIAYVAARRVAMTDMPQMVAIYNGMGGGAAALIAANEFLHFGGSGLTMGASFAVLGAVGALIGAISFSGSMIAFAKLQGIIKKSFLFPGQNVINLVVLAGAVALGAFVILQHTGHLGGPVGPTLGLFFALALLYGVLMTLPIGGADMPVVISLLNSFTGLAVAADGFAINNLAMVVAGTLVGSSGTLLTLLMCKAMNRPVTNVLFGAFGSGGGGGKGAAGDLGGKTVKPIQADEAALLLGYAQQVVIVPGYGMAVAQAQHQVRELADELGKRGVEVRFAIHPVAGRMPGHMNVLLAEANVPYDQLCEMEAINPTMDRVDVCLVIGANDVVNPAAREDKSSPIYGMPIIDADRAKTVIVMKRSMAAGFAGIENLLFYKDNTRMLFGDAKASLQTLIAQLKAS
jgi:NAD(P) transhydrogenase subunit beta